MITLVKGETSVLKWQMSIWLSIDTVLQVKFLYRVIISSYSFQKSSKFMDNVHYSNKTSCEQKIATQPIGSLLLCTRDISWKIRYHSEECVDSGIYHWRTISSQSVKLWYIKYVLQMRWSNRNSSHFVFKNIQLWIHVVLVRKYSCLQVIPLILDCWTCY